MVVRERGGDEGRLVRAGEQRAERELGRQLPGADADDVEARGVRQRAGALELDDLAARRRARSGKAARADADEATGISDRCQVGQGSGDAHLAVDQRRGGVRGERRESRTGFAVEDRPLLCRPRGDAEPGGAQGALGGRDPGRAPPQRGILGGEASGLRSGEERSGGSDSERGEQRRPAAAAQPDSGEP